MGVWFESGSGQSQTGSAALMYEIKMRYRERDLEVPLLGPVPHEEAETVQDEGEQGEEEKARQDGEDQDPQGDAPALPNLQGQHLQYQGLERNRHCILAAVQFGTRCQNRQEDPDPHLDPSYFSRD